METASVESSKTPTTYSATANIWDIAATVNNSHLAAHSVTSLPGNTVKKTMK